MPDIYSHIDRIILGSTRPIFVEIGAAWGDDTAKIIERLTTLKPGVAFEYYAFEPDPRNLAGLEKAATHPSVHIIPAAVGDTDRRATFHQSGGKNPWYGYEHTLSGSLKQPVEHLRHYPWCKFDATVEVNVTTLDTFFEAFGLSHIDFIWCDAQGAEDMILAGGAKALARTKFLFTEYYNNEMYDGQIPDKEILRRLGAGWKIVEQYPFEILFENDFTGTAVSPVG
jgi:FkbM family methyltransferase